MISIGLIIHGTKLTRQQLRNVKKKCGFNVNLCGEKRQDGDICDEEDDDDDDDMDVPISIIKASRSMFGCEFRNLIEIVSSIKTCDESLRDWGAPASQVLSDLDKVNEESGSEEETQFKWQKGVHL